MVIKASAAAEVRQLIAALGREDVVAREAAVARLAILGDRAVERLVAAFRTADRVTRIGILRALDAGADDRALPVARAALTEGGDASVAATGVLRTLLDSPAPGTAAAALDTLMSVVLHESADHRLRRAAAEALESVPAVREQIAAALQGIPDARPGGSDAEATWQDAAEGRLPDAPSALRQAAQAFAADAPLGVLQQLVDRVRAREQAAEPSRLRQEWSGVRGALHQALALRGSRVALYDLRESLAEAADPLPASFLAALHAVGDDSCLEGIAAAYEGTDDVRWRAQLRDAFQAILRREHITRRAAVLKRLASKRPEAFRALVVQRPGTNVSR
jgi:hypothetical protein